MSTPSLKVLCEQTIHNELSRERIFVHVYRHAMAYYKLVCPSLQRKFRIPPEDMWALCNYSVFELAKSDCAKWVAFCKTTCTKTITEEELEKKFHNLLYTILYRKAIDYVRHRARHEDFPRDSAGILKTMNRETFGRAILQSTCRPWKSLAEWDSLVEAVEEDLNCLLDTQEFPEREEIVQAAIAELRRNQDEVLRCSRDTAETESFQGRLVSLIYSIYRRCCEDFLHKYEVQYVPPEDLGDDDQMLLAQRNLGQSERARMIGDCLEAMDPECRLLLKLRYADMLEPREIARLLGYPNGGKVSDRIHKTCIPKLNKCLEGKGIRGSDNVNAD